MKITVYIPCHNGEKTVPDVMEALRSQGRQADQCLFVNDRSSDASVEIARKYSFEVRETGPDQFGLAAGRNVALAHAQGDILVGCDADAVAEPTFLGEVEMQFARRPDIVGLCGCMNEKYSNETLFDRWRSIHMPQRYGPNEIENPPNLFGSSSAHRTGFLRRLGGWNPKFKTNYEDMDLTQRIHGAGGRTLYAPACQLWHLRRDTLESVLKGYWNWHYPLGDVHGHYDSLDKWRQGRLPWIWHDYRLKRLQDLASPQIAVITCLLPWSIMIRDLHQLYSRRGRAIDLTLLPRMAEQSFIRMGANREVADWLKSWMTKEVIGSLNAFSGPEETWDGQLLQEIELAVLISIPDANYWNAVRSVFVNTP